MKMSYVTLKKTHDSISQYSDMQMLMNRLDSIIILPTTDTTGGVNSLTTRGNVKLLSLY